MLTPAQNPRGLARMIFTRASFRTCSCYRFGGRKQKAHGTTRGPAVNFTAGAGLLPIDLRHGDPLLPVLLAHRTGDGPFRRRLADLLVIGFVALGVEVVDD